MGLLSLFKKGMTKATGVAKTPETSQPQIIPRAPFYDNSQRNQEFLRNLRLSVECTIGSYDVDENLYWRAEDTARKGKDPRQLLRAIEFPDSTRPYQLAKTDINTGPLASEFARKSFLKANKFGSPGYTPGNDLRTIGKSLTDEQKQEVLDIMNNGFECYLNQRGRVTNGRINKILRFYDEGRQEHNIQNLLKKARVRARAGNIESTLDVLEQIERRATGDWTNEIFDVYSQAYQARFNSQIEKAERAFVKSRYARGMEHLARAEQYAREIGLPFKASDPSSIKKYLTKRSFDSYAQTSKLYRTLISMLEQVTRQKEGSRN